MKKPKFESQFYFNQIYRLRQRAIYFAVLSLMVFVYVDTIRFTQPLLNQVIVLRLLVQLLPITIILITSSLQHQNKVNKQVYYWITAICVFFIGVGHAEILVAAYKSQHFFPKVGMAIILYYAGILLALPLAFAATSSFCIILYATITYSSVGLPTDEVISTSVFYVVFSACCVFMNTVTSQMLKNNVKLVKHINDQANTDSLTNLKNRRAFFEHADHIIKQSYRKHEQFALMIIDLDNFKKVNDILGHQKGDEVLTMVAQILKAHSRRPLDLASRYGGDEFVLLLYGINEKDVQFICNKIIFEVEQITKNIADKNLTIKLGISIGVVFNDININHSINNLVEMADQALYQVKNNGKKSFAIAHMQHAIQTDNDSDFMSAL
ncbi:MAG: GGDEF domain-containing protein [Marinicella sp.]|nr:GGDEF domain-containing protein [Xanthomonadales bacterium]